ncbi:MAG: epoxide hydrolase [Actinobacteria bacterium]|nr:epoxide hydrolase [Actinomycetota bacterium]
MSGMRLETVTIDFPEELIVDLHRRLDAVRWPEIGFDPGWDMGMDAATLRDLVHYWRHEYDWFAVQDELNRLDHRMMEMEGERFHFVTWPSPGAPAVIAIHGWPGSFSELIDGAELLHSSGYEVVVPSLPGFGLSDPPRRRGVHGGVMAERFHQLMLGLGHDRYGVQGGDGGSVVGPAMAGRHPETVVGLHINLIPGSPRPPEGVEPDAEEQAWREERDRFEEYGLGYYDVQALRPDALSYGLADSPVGLLAWVLEKFWSWSGNDDDIWRRFDRDRFLTNVMLYWLPNRVLSSTRIYHEMTFATEPIRAGHVSVPTGYLRMPDEPWAPPRAVAERVANIVHYTEARRGGHFAAMEEPSVWAEDVDAFFKSLGLAPA